MYNKNLQPVYSGTKTTTIYVESGKGLETHYRLNEAKKGKNTLTFKALYYESNSDTELIIPAIICDEDEIEYVVTDIDLLLFYKGEVDDQCKVQKVILPDSIKHIDPCAFALFPDSLKEIELSDLSLLKNAILPNGVNLITESYKIIDLRPEYEFEVVFKKGLHLLFEQDSNHSVCLCSYDDAAPPLHLVIPEKVVGKYDDEYKVTEIGDSCFEECDELESVIIPDSVRTISKKAFCCSNLNHVVISNTVRTIAQDAFSFTELTSFHLPKDVFTVEGPILAGCADLTTLIVDKKNPFYDSRNNCNAIIETSTNTLIQGYSQTIIPNTVTGINEKAFIGCDFKTINIPNSVEFIGEGAFEKCDKLEEIVISDASLLNDADVPEGVTIITPEEKKRAIGRILSTLGAK